MAENAVNLSQVANELRRVAVFFKGLVDAAAVLDQAQQIEEAAKAADQRIALANTELARVTAEAQAAVDNANAKMQQAHDELVAAKEVAKKTIADAKEKAKQIIADGDAKIAQAVEEATRDARQRATSLEQQSVDLEARVAALAEKSVALDAECVDKQKALDKIVADLAAMQKKAAKLAGVED